jgi:hypothetical protein
MPPGALQAAGRLATGTLPLNHARNYGEFWQRYLGAHKSPRTRALHYVGTFAAIGLIALAAASRDGRWLVAVPLVGYGPAWLAHLAIERNRPETFSHPVWSLVSDIRMLGLFLTGRLAAEIRRLEIER